MNLHAECTRLADLLGLAVPDPAALPDGTLVERVQLLLDSSVTAAGRKGGAKRREQLGNAGYAKLGAKGGAAVHAKHGREYYQRIGRLGGMKRKENLGSAGFAALGAKGGARRKAQLGEGGYAELGAKGGASRKKAREAGSVTQTPESTGE